MARRCRSLAKRRKSASSPPAAPGACGRVHGTRHPPSAAPTFRGTHLPRHRDVEHFQRALLRKSVAPWRRRVGWQRAGFGFPAAWPRKEAGDLNRGCTLMHADARCRPGLLRASGAFRCYIVTISACGGRARSSGLKTRGGSLADRARGSPRLRSAGAGGRGCVLLAPRVAGPRPARAAGAAERRAA